MNTRYPNGVPLFGTGRAGVNLEQLFLAPTVAYKLNEHNAIGASLNIGYQMFQAEGLQNFANSTFSSSPGNVTNRGYNNSFGTGFRVGWLGKLTNYLSVGATYQSRTYMQNFDKYQGLFAEQGGFDIPSNVGAGVAAMFERNTKPMTEANASADATAGFAAPDFPPILLDAGSGHTFTMLGTTMRLIGTAAGTGGRYTVIEQVTPAG